MRLDAALGDAKAAAVADATAALAALGDVRDLGDRDYAKAKKSALKALRAADRRP